MADIKMDLESYAHVTGLYKNDEFLFTLNGHNSNRRKVQVQVTISAWQFNDMVVKVGEIHRRRIKNQQNELERFKKSVEPPINF